MHTFPQKVEQHMVSDVGHCRKYEQWLWHRSTLGCIPQALVPARSGGRVDGAGPHRALLSSLSLLVTPEPRPHPWHSGAPRDLTFDPTPILVIGCVFNPLPPFSINGAQGLDALDPLLTPAARTLSHLSHGLGEVTPYNLHSDSETSVISEAC